MDSSVRIVCSRWVSPLLFALVFLSQLLCVDVKGLEGVNGQQHVSNVSLGIKKMSAGIQRIHTTGTTRCLQY